MLIFNSYVNSKHFSFLFRHLFIWALLIAIVSTFGCLFLWMLQTVSSYRMDHLWIIFFLPIVGYATTYSYQKWGGNFQNGNTQLVVSADSNTFQLPFLAAPFIFISTVLSHMVGASVGRESTAVQMSAGWATAIGKYFRLSPQLTSVFVRSAVAAGFSAVFGTPLTASIFAFEWSKSHLKVSHFLIVSSSSFCSFYLTTFWPISHLHFPEIPKIDWYSENTLFLIIFGIAAGIISFIFIYLTHFLPKVWSKIQSPSLRTFYAGSIILALTFIWGDTTFLGLGLSTIEQAFLTGVPFTFFMLKMLFTLLSTSGGFKGGEVTPLFFIGACLGSSYAIYMGTDSLFWAAIGLVVPFAACTKTPFACGIMAYELFGIHVLLPALICAGIAVICSGKSTIYERK